MGLINQSLLNNRGNSVSNNGYRARVEDNLDPKHLGRVRVRIPQLYGIIGTKSYIESKDLPWAYPKSSIGAGYDHGSIIVPEIGDYVFVEFENGNRDKLIYEGGSFGSGPERPKPYGKIGQNGPCSDELYDGGGWQSYPQLPELPYEVYEDGNAPTGKVIYKSPKGAVIYVQERDEEESINIIDRLGQSIRLKCPVTKENNRLNSSRRLSESSDTRSGSDNPAKSPSICVDETSEILIKDASGQTLRLQSKPEGSNILLQSAGKNDSVTITDTTISVQAGDQIVIKLDRQTGLLSISSPKIQITTDEATLNSKSINAVSSDSVNVTTPNTTFNGDVTINGDLNVYGEVYDD